MSFTATFFQGTTSRAEPDGKATVPAVKFDEGKMATTYVNAYRIYTTDEETVVDLGFNMPNPDVAEGASGNLLFSVSDRAIMTYATTKRLRDSLDRLIKRYEDKFGEISVQAKPQK